MNIRRALALQLLPAVTVLLFLLPASVSADGCTANLTCSNACNILFHECAPPSCCILSCSAPSQTLSCSGTTSCSVGTNSVTCDGNTHYCSSNQCFNNGDFIQCGSTIKRCNSNCAC